MSKQKTTKATSKEAEVNEAEEAVEIDVEESSPPEAEGSTEKSEEDDSAEEKDVTPEEVGAPSTAAEDVIDETEAVLAEAEAEDAAEAEEKGPTLEEELELAQQEAAKNLDNWQRTAAEFANYKRRQEEQRKLQRDRIKGEVLDSVVSALDDLNLAFQNLPEELDGQLVGWVEGFRLVQRKLDRILEDQNVMPIETTGKFDPNFHEAVSYEDSEDHGENDIIAELRKGYQIGSRIIRPALVRVAK